MLGYLLLTCVLRHHVVNNDNGIFKQVIMHIMMTRYDINCDSVVVVLHVCMHVEWFDDGW